MATNGYAEVALACSPSRLNKSAEEVALTTATRTAIAAIPYLVPDPPKINFIPKARFPHFWLQQVCVGDAGLNRIASTKRNLAEGPGAHPSSEIHQCPDALHAATKEADRPIRTVEPNRIWLSCRSPTVYPPGSVKHLPDRNATGDVHRSRPTGFRGGGRGRLAPAPPRTTADRAPPSPRGRTT